MINQKFIYFLFFFLMFLGTYFLFKSGNCHSNEYDSEYAYEYNIAFSRIRKNVDYSRRIYQTPMNRNQIQEVSKEKIAEWKREYDFHKKEGDRTYNDAKDRCWWLPNVNEREQARYCFVSAIGLLGNGTPCSKLVSCVTALLAQYGLDAISEYHYINNKLYWSEYHFSMAELYWDLIQQNQ